MPGYSGVNCSSLCPYPYYGAHCQKTCNCSSKMCNVSTGCIVELIGNHIFFYDPKKGRCINLISILILRTMVSF